MLIIQLRNIAHQYGLRLVLQQVRMRLLAAASLCGARVVTRLTKVKLHR